MHCFFLFGRKSMSFNQQQTKVGAGAIILDAGYKLLGVQDILFGLNNKVYDPFVIIFSQLQTANGVGTIILDAGDKLLCVQVTFYFLLK